MTASVRVDNPQFERLKARHRSERSCQPQNLSLRLHRALSWLDRAEQESEDFDAAFIFYWIAFNAAYSEDNSDAIESTESANFQAYFVKALRLDTDNKIYNALWERFSGPVRLLLDNRYVFNPFWKHHNGVPGFANWERRFNTDRLQVNDALARSDTETILVTLFQRLYVLRNQLIHGGATWNSSVNRGQVRDGARIMAFLVPLFIELMMDNPHKDWGKPYYPVVES